MMTAAVCQPLPARSRQRILAVVDKLVARALAASFRSSELTVAHTSGEALIEIARGHRYDLVVCHLEIAAALALHAAIARRDPATAGRMVVLLPP
jgi:CheY-like chemotaxis protein